MLARKMNLTKQMYVLTKLTYCLGRQYIRNQNPRDRSMDDEKDRDRMRPEGEVTF